MLLNNMLNAIRSKVALWILPNPGNSTMGTASSSPASTSASGGNSTPVFSAGSTTSAQYTTRPETRKIVQQELQREAKDLRKDFISIFGLFAAFITFTVLQIQALIQSARMALIIGCMAFFLAVSLTFVLSLHNMIHEKNGWKEFTRPVFVAILIVFFFSFECFWYASHNGKFFLFG